MKEEIEGMYETHQERHSKQFGHGKDTTQLSDRYQSSAIYIEEKINDSLTGLTNSTNINRLRNCPF